MLSLESPIGPINGLQIYRDHAAGNTFYYVPERPRIAVNEGKPEFIFLKYRRDITDNPDLTDAQKKNLGGGLLAFTVDLGITDEVFAATRSALSQYATGSGPIQLGPVPFRAGTVRLSMISDKPPANDSGTAPANDKGLKIFEHHWGATTPSLFGDNRATFGLTMGHEAAVLLEAALKAGVGYIGVIYDLEYLGMRPAYNVKVTADYSRIYNHFEAELGLEGQIYAVAVKGQVGVGLQKLEDEGALKIEVTTFTDSADLIKQAEAARDWAREKILTDLFKSSLKPPSFMTRTESSPLQFLSTMLAGQTGGRAPNNQLTSRTPATTQTQNSSAVQSSQVQRPTPAPTTLGGRSNHVQNPQTQTPSSSGPTSNNMSPFKVGFSLKYYRQEELKKRVFDFSRQAAEKARAAPQGLLSTLLDGHDLREHIIEVSLDDDFYKRLKLDVDVSADWEHAGIDVVAVSAEYPGNLAANAQPEHAAGFTFTAQANATQLFQTWLNDDKVMDYRYAVETHFKADSPWVGQHAVVRSGWQTARHRPLIVNPLDHMGLMTVQIAADGTLNFNEELLQAKVEVEYDDGDWQTQDTFLLDAKNRSHTWKLRLTRTEHRTFRYRTTYAFSDNTRYATPWKTHESDDLLIGSPFTMRSIRIVPTFDATEIIEAIVDLRAVDPDSGFTRQEQVIFTPTDMGSKTVALEQIGDADYTYTVTIIPQIGAPFEGDPIASNARYIRVGRGASDVERISVKLAADAAALANVYAVQVELKGPTGEIDTEVFSASTVDETRAMWVVPKTDEPLAYSWRLTRYGRDGQAQSGEWVPSTLRLLIVPVGS